MVHFDNIEYILINGMCIRAHPLADPDYINIGDTQLISQRNEYEVRINPPNGFLGEYVPFYFGGHTPMLLNIKTGYRGIKQRPQREIVFVCCSIGQILEFCKSWCFTNGHAKDKITEFYNDLQHLDKIDWEIVNSQWWNNTSEDMDRQRRKQAEFLVKEYVTTSCFHSLIVRDQQRKSDVEQIVRKAGLNIPVKIDSNNQFFYP